MVQNALMFYDLMDLIKTDSSSLMCNRLYRNTMNHLVTVDRLLVICASACVTNVHFPPKNKKCEWDVL